MNTSSPLAFVAALIAASSAQAAEPRPFYTGKTVTIVTGEPAGGASDTYTRLLSRHLAKHVPGAPNIIVQNLPGAGTLKAVISVGTTAPPDGTFIATFSSALIEQAIVAPQRVRADFRNYNWIGNISEDVRVCYVWAASGLQTFKDVTARTNPLFWGATAPGTAGNADASMLQNLLGVKIKQVQGYAGAADKRLAVERREIDGDCGGWTALPEDWLRDKKINVLVRLSPTLVPGMDRTIPFGGDLLSDARDKRVYDFITAPERLGRVFMVSNKVPADRMTALRTAFDETVKDQAFLAEAERLRLLVTPMTGVEVANRIAELYATPPDLVARAKAIVGE